MAEPSGQYTKLPPGWDCKFDQTTGNCYYINYFTKAMQLEDPRIRYKQLQNEKCSTESIPMQPLHGSPYHVYPANNFPAIRAFQGPNPSLHNISASPLLSTKSQLQMEMSPVSHLKTSAPQTPRTGNMSRRSTIQETSFSSQTDTDTVVTKIQNMFPTAGENHIRLLLKKYMKNIFPKADETLLLDILANADNNVQKASETLIAMGYVKRDVAPPPKLTNRGDGQPMKYEPEDSSKIIPLRPKTYTAEEKDQMKIRLQEKFNDIAERIILMALESVNYSEDRASQILQIVQDEDESRAKKDADALQAALAADSCTDGMPAASSNLQVPTRSSTKSTPKLKSDKSTPVPTTTSTNTYPTNDVHADMDSSVAKEHRKDSIHAKKNSPRESTEEEPDVLQKPDFKSILGRIATMGHKTEYTKGPDDNLLLADYVTWNGANPDISLGRKNIAIGSDTGIVGERTYIANGRNPELCKGPKAGLAKGSIYSQLSSTGNTNIKCN